jgi:Zinc finger, C2H2 type
MENKKFQCEICLKSFSTKNGLGRHKSKKNICVFEDNRYKCDICNKTFSQKSHLINHQNKKNPCTETPSITTQPNINDMMAIIKQKDEKYDKLMEALLLNQNLPNPNNIMNDSHDTTNENSHNTQNTNSHNTNSHNSNMMNNMSNSCLIQYVINQYPNAKNIEDCIKLENIPKMTLTECEDLYFTDGAMKIFKGLCDLGEENRPIHCTDINRCNYIYKSNDVWKIDVGGEAIRNHFFPVIQEAYTQVHKNRIKNNPGNSSIIGNYLTEMTGTNVKKICQKTLKRLTNDFLAKNSKKYKLIKMQEKN